MCFFTVQAIQKTKGIKMRLDKKRWATIQLTDTQPSCAAMANTKEQVCSWSMIARICEVLEAMQPSLASLKAEEKVERKFRCCLSAAIRSSQTLLGEREAREREWLFRRAASIRLTGAHRPVSGVPACW